MKSKSSFLSMVFFLAICAAVQAVKADSVSGSVAKDFWVKAYTGYDIASLGDISNGIKAWSAYTTALGFSPSTNTDTSGLVAGGEFGFQFDPEDAISLGCEDMWGSTLSSSGTSGSTTYNFSYAPSVLDLTLNYTRTLFEGGGAKTLVFVGGGLYFASGNFSFTVPTGNTNVSGTFNGSTLGGLLGISEDVSLSDTFSVLVSVKGNLATISHLTSTNLGGTYNGSAVPSGTYDLVLTQANSPGYTILYGQNQASPYGAGTNTSFAAQDESGFQGDIALAAHF
jgi:hypothetical protein